MSYPPMPQTHYFGVPILKNPGDLWTNTEILWECKPDTLVEVGTYCGGSALYYAHQFDLLGKGRVISVDLNAAKWLNGRPLPEHPRITWVHGESSVTEACVAKVKALVEGRVMVDLDSDHTESHVAKEIELYSSLVSPGQYLIVEDGCIGEECGPLAAINKFDWTGWQERDDKASKFKGLCFPYNPRGYWIKL